MTTANTPHRPAPPGQLPLYIVGPGASLATLEPLLAAEWTDVGHADSTEYISPDGLVVITLTDNPQTAWQVRAYRDHGDPDAVWSVAFSADTPAEFLAALIRALADATRPRPAPRGRPAWLYGG